MFDTIAAISSGNINQPISIIRVSGPDAFAIVKKIFSGKVGKDKSIVYGHIVEQGEKVDEVLVSWFVAPKTFTGENMVEINAHGNIVNTNRILGLVLAHGARLADPGEFSRQAFLNNKIDLVKAEAIHDLIFARTEEQAKLAVRQFDGQTSDLISKLKTKLLHIIAAIETNIDYPEYDDAKTHAVTELLPQLLAVSCDIDEVLASSKMSRFAYEGVNAVIVGKPNVGKSSLLNALINEDKAIVTDVPGTTRDAVEGQIQIGQVLFRLKDTAGVRPTANAIEQIGIKKTLELIATADLVIHLCDPFSENDANDSAIKNAAGSKNYLQVFNKSDLKKAGGINISVKLKNLTPLIDAIKNMFPAIDINDAKIITNTRQLALIKASRQAIGDAISGLESKMDPSVVIIDIQKAWEDLANILGRAEQADLLDMMFKTFCLGK